MNEILKAVLSLSLSGSLLILLLFLLRPLFKERLSKRWQYYIWLVVVARLLLPFAPETNLMATLFQGIDRTIEQSEIVSPYTQQGGITDIPQTDDMENGQNNLHSGQTEPVESTSNPVRNIVTAVWKNLWLGWLVVALILFIRKITVYQDFVKYIRAGCVEVAEIDLLERFGKLIERNKVKTTVELYTNNLISSPLLIGFFRPSIVLPSADLSPVDFEYTILHELTHFKRRDMFYKWLVQFSVCVHWFNPLVYLMSREVGRTCELSCDETVIRVLDPQGRRAYGDTLLNAMGAGGNYKDSLASVTLNESKELLKERLDAIMGFKKATRLTSVFSITLTCLFCFGATVTGVYASEKEQTTTPKYIAYQTEQNQTTQKSFNSIIEYANFYNLKSQSVSSLCSDIQNAIALISVQPRETTTREVSEGIYAEFWTRTEIRTTGRYVWSEILITNGKDDDKQILLKLKTPDLLITNGSISLPENALGSVEGLAWSGSAISEQQKDGEISYVKTTFTAQLTIGNTTQIITPICTMVSNAPKGNTYRIGLINAVWNGTDGQNEIPIPQVPKRVAPNAPTVPDVSNPANTPNVIISNPDTTLISISVDKLDAYGVACVGQISLEKDVKYYCDLTAESGQGLFLAFSTSNQITTVYGTAFGKSYGSGFDRLDSSVSASWTTNEPINYYVYVCNLNAEAGLKNITGSIYLDN